LGDPPSDSLHLPDAVLMRPTITAIFDNVRDEITITTPVWPREGVDARAAYAGACQRLNTTIDRIRRGIPESSTPLTTAASADIHSNISKADYVALVERAKEYIRAGDIFQVVP